MSTAVTPNSMVWGRRSMSISSTGLLKRIDSPKSPRNMSRAKMTNWVESGLSRPFSALKVAQMAGVAFSPNMAVQGSPGMARASKNVTIKTPTMTGMAAIRRRIVYWVTWAS